MVSCYVILGFNCICFGMIAKVINKSSNAVAGQQNMAVSVNSNILDQAIIPGYMGIQIADESLSLY